MSLLKKIVIIGVVLASVVVVGVNVAQAAISAGCRADISTCTSAELSEYITELTTTLNALQEKVAELSGEEAATGTPAACTGITFTSNLSQGMSGDDVKCLQALLNTDTATKVAESGAGSPGSETTYFGPLTKAAVIKFQEKYADTVLTPLGLTSGTGFVGEKTRAKLNAILAAGVPAEEEEEEEEEVPVEEEEEVPVSGLSVALGADTPAAASVPINTGNILFTTIDFTAGTEGDITVNAITVTRTGLGADTDVTGVTLYDVNEKLSSTRNSFNSLHQMAFNITGGWTIPAGETKTLSIRAKLATAGTYNALGIAADTDITAAEGEISGSFPIYGYQMTGVSVSVGEVSVDGEGVTSQAKKIGIDSVTLASFSLEANSVEDVQFEKIVLKNKGTASDSDIGNVYLMKGTDVLAGPVSMVRDYVTLVLDEPYLIKKSDKVTFKVVGDIESGDTRTVEFILNNDIDLVCTGETYGYAAIVVRSEFDATTDSHTTLTTISGAQLNLNLVSSSQESPDEVYNVVFATLELTASAEDTRITNLIITINENDGNSVVGDNKDVDELELVDTADGSAYSGTMTGGGDTNANDETWTFDDEIYLTQGVKRTFEIRGDLPAGIGDGDQYNVAITADTTNIEAEGVISGDTIDDFSVSSLTGLKVTVKTADLTILSSPMLAGDAVIDAKDVVIFTGVLSAGPASAITIDRMKFEQDAANQFDIENISRAVLYTGDGNVEQVLTYSELSAGVADFSSLNIIVPARSANAITFGVKVDIKHTLTANTTVRIQLDTVSARDSDGDSVSAVKEDGTTVIADTAELDTDRIVTLHGYGKLKVAIPVSDADVMRDRYALADTVTDWVGKIKVRAENESVLIKDLYLQNASADDEDSVKTISLYKADKITLIGGTQLLGTDLAAFSDLNYKVALGTEYLYIKADLRKIGTGASDTADSADELELKVYAIVAEGGDSGAALTTGNVNGTCADGEICYDTDLDGTYDETNGNGDYVYTSNTKKFTVTGTKLTAVDLVSSFSGSTLAANISGSATYNVAILKVVNSATTNTDTEGVILKNTLKELNLRCDKDTATLISSATIQRIGGSTAAQAITITACDGSGETTGLWTLNNADTALGNDAKLESGETAYFLIKAAITVGANVDTITIGADDLDGGDGDATIRWYDGTTTFEKLRLDYTTVDGIKITELVT